MGSDIIGEISSLNGAVATSQKPRLQAGAVPGNMAVVPAYAAVRMLHASRRGAEQSKPRALHDA